MEKRLNKPKELEVKMTDNLKKVIPDKVGEQIKSRAKEIFKSQLENMKEHWKNNPRPKIKSNSSDSADSIKLHEPKKFNIILYEKD